MELRVLRLGPGDAGVLDVLAREDAFFELEDGGAPRTPLAPGDADAYLSDPAVLHWVAQADDRVVGSLVCHVLKMRKQPAREVLLFEIGVRAAWRRKGVGRTLVRAMTDWMAAEDVRVAWVLGDNRGAWQFYEACGFERRPTPRYYELVRAG